MNIKQLLMGMSASALMLGSTVVPAFATTEVVHPGNLQEWNTADTRPG